MTVLKFISQESAILVCDVTYFLKAQAVLSGDICFCAGQGSVVFEGIVLHGIFNAEKHEIFHLLNSYLDFTEAWRRDLPAGVKSVINLIGQHTTYINRINVVRRQNMRCKIERNAKVFRLGCLMINDGIYYITFEKKARKDGSRVLK